MKLLYKTTKVIYDAHLKQYQVYYKNWFVWKFDSAYKFDENPSRPVYYANKEQAKERAIKRASDMLDTVEVWKQTNITYY
jgi:alpha-L-fucosidase